MKLTRLTAIILMASVLISGCTVKDTKEDIKKEPQKIVQQEPQDDPFYTKMQNSDTRPIAVMIDNDDKSARPQLGLESAYLVYEIIVEGGATRFMALFNEHELEKIGPVRSSRHYFIDYAMENDAIYVHCGYSPQAARDLRNFGINNINGVTGSDGAMFWRDNTYDRTWHNLYTSLKNISAFSKDTKKYRTTSDTKLLKYNKQDSDIATGEAATHISIPYSQGYKVDYEYDSEAKRYVRSINGEPHTSQTGEVLSSKNVIVYKVNNYTLNDGENKGRQDIKNIGNGSGYYFTNGKAVKINWSKPTRSDKTVYTLENGEELKLNPGNTYIQIMPLYNELSVTGLDNSYQ